MIAGKRKELSLQQAPSMEEIEKLTNKLSRAIKEVLESLDGQPYFHLEKEVKKKTHMFYLTIGKFKRVFRLGIPLTAFPENKPAVDIKLNMLKRKLDSATVKKLLKSLSMVPKTFYTI